MKVPFSKCFFLSLVTSHSYRQYSKVSFHSSMVHIYFSEEWLPLLFCEMLFIGLLYILINQQVSSSFYSKFFFLFFFFKKKKGALFFCSIFVSLLMLFSSSLPGVHPLSFPSLFPSVCLRFFSLAKSASR